jgi:hypothetical protein
MGNSWIFDRLTTRTKYGLKMFCTEIAKQVILLGFMYRVEDQLDATRNMLTLNMPTTVKKNAISSACDVTMAFHKGTYGQQLNICFIVQCWTYFVWFTVLSVQMQTALVQNIWAFYFKICSVCHMCVCVCAYYLTTTGLRESLGLSVRRKLISLWLYKENKSRDKKKKYIYICTLHIAPWAPHTYDFVVLTSLTHPWNIRLIVLQIGK